MQIQSYIHRAAGTTAANNFVTPYIVSFYFMPASYLVTAVLGIVDMVIGARIRRDGRIAITIIVSNNYYLIILITLIVHGSNCSFLDTKTTYRAPLLPWLSFWLQEWHCCMYQRIWQLLIMPSLEVLTAASLTPSLLSLWWSFLELLGWSLAAWVHETINCMQ